MHDAPPLPRAEKIYFGLAAAFVTLLVLTNIVGIKLFEAPFVPSVALPASIVCYPLTFLVTDVVSEFYGKKRADFLVLLGFAMSLLSLLVLLVATGTEPHAAWAAGELPFYDDAAGYQHAFESVFSINGTLLLASMSAYLSAQLIDNRLFHFWKALTKGKHLWLRNNGSTMISQLVDTVVVGCILYYWGFGMDFETGLSIMIAMYVTKLAIAALDTPLIYLCVAVLGRYVKHDVEVG